MPLRVTSEATNWPTHSDRPPLAGVSGFGWSGTNAHLVVGGYGAPGSAPLPVGSARRVGDLPRTEEELGGRGARILPLSGKTGQGAAGAGGAVSEMAR